MDIRAKISVTWPLYQIVLEKEEITSLRRHRRRAFVELSGA